MAESIQHCVYLPIPGPPTTMPGTRSERLKAIITNIDAQRNQVRAAIVHDGKQALAAHARTRAASTAMDIDDRTPPPSPNRAALSQLYDHLHAPYDESAGDPCARVPSPPEATRVPPPRAGVPQSDAPIEVKVAVEVLERLETYDRLTREARFGIEYYAHALQRMEPNASRVGSLPVPSPPPPPPPPPPAPPADAQFVPGGNATGRKLPLGASPLDPRMRGRAT